MNLGDFLKSVDQQMAAERERQQKPVGDRRQNNVPVPVDRRSGIDRRTTNRMGPPQRENYPDQAAYDRAYDAWSMSNRGGK
jgi:hypothetical protein